MKKVFIDFLEEKGTLEKFSEAIKKRGFNCIESYLDSTFPINFVLKAFKWHENGGWKYWNEIDVEWKAVLNDKYKIL